MDHWIIDDLLSRRQMYLMLLLIGWLLDVSSWVLLRNNDPFFTAIRNVFCSLVYAISSESFCGKSWHITLIDVVVLMPRYYSLSVLVLTGLHSGKGANLSQSIADGAAIVFVIDCGADNLRSGLRLLECHLAVLHMLLLHYCREILDLTIRHLQKYSLQINKFYQGQTSFY